MLKFTSSATRSKVLLTLTLVLLTVVLANVALFGGAVSSEVAYAAGNYDATDGLQFGPNNLSTHKDFENGVKGTDGTFTLEKGVTVTASPKIAIGASSSELPGQVAPKGKEVYYALRDKDTIVSAIFTATFYTESAVTETFDVEIKIEYSKNGSDVAYSATQSFTVESSTGNAYNGVQSVSTTLKPTGKTIYDSETGIPSYEIDVAEGACFKIQVTNNATTTSIKMKEPKISLSSETIQQNLDMGTGIRLKISGKNRKDVIIADALQEGALDGVYVKSGDIITLYAISKSTYSKQNGETLNTNSDFSMYYNLSVGRAGESCIEWSSKMESISGTTVKTCLSRSADQDGSILVTYPKNDGDTEKFNNNLNTYYGFSASFTVGSSSANGRTISISPRLIKGYDTNGSLEYWDNAENEIIVKLDNSIPVAPVLDISKTLGLAIENGTWYTASSSFTLDYQNGSDSYDNKANEFVYAMIVSKDFTSLVTNYDFTPYDVEPADGDYSYGVGNKTLVTKRQELGDFSETKTSGKKKIEFDENGEYGLILYAVDEAGNVSSPMVYSYTTNKKTVKVDSSVRNVGANFLYNGTTVIPSKSNLKTYNKYAYAYLCVGSDYHDVYGEFTGKYPISNTDTTNAGQSANEGYIAVKRGTWVTLRVVMTEANTADYALIRFYNDIGMSNSDPKYSVGRDNCRIYDLTFQMTDAIWNSTTGNFPISVTFNRRVDLMMSTDEDKLIYTKKWDNPETIQLSFEAYFAKGDETVTIQPEIGVTYYNTELYYIYANFATLEDGTISLTTGGRIEINGVTYDFDDTEDLKDYIAGRKSFITTDVYGEHEYLAYGKSNPQGIYTDPETGKRYQLYAVDGYDVASAQTTGVTDAGTYYYIASVVTTAGTLPYYGETAGAFTVSKADPGVLNVKASRELTYGDSLSALSFTSTDANGKIITETTVEIAGKVYQKVASGVYGEFVIISPQPGSDEYTKHDVISSYKIEVQFNPLDVTAFSSDVITQNFDQFFNQYYERVTDDFGSFAGYKLISGKQTASNYNSVVYQVTVTINHKFAVVGLDSFATEVSATYDGSPKEVTPIVYMYENGKEVVLEDVPVIIEYKLNSETEYAYSLEAPTVAGVYNVRMRIDDTASNYKSDSATVVTLTISQRELDIEIIDSDEHAVVDETSVGGYIYTDTLTYTYGLETTARYTASYRDDAEVKYTVDGLEYSLSFTKIFSFDATGGTVECQDDQWTEGVTVISPKYLDAGVYILKVEIVNVNNAGTKYIRFNVNQVKQNDATKLTVSAPTVKTNYYNIPLSGKAGEKTGHIEYGQTLAEMRDTLIGNGGLVRFTPRGTGGSEIVPGRFYFETETEYATRKKDSKIIETNTAGEAILPVKYDEQSGAILSYDVFMYWQAGTYDEEGNFIPDYNFRRETIGTNISVVRARADFDDFNLKTITYGQSVSETVFEGTVKSNGYVFDADDFTISVNTDYIGLVPEYGENYITCTFTPSEDLLKRYVIIDDVKISLFVEKREVAIAFETQTVEAGDCDDEEHSDAVVFVYGSNYSSPATTISPKDIEDLDVSSAVLQFTYYRDKAEDETVDAINLLIIDGKEYVKVGTIDSSTPVGKYYVLAEVVDGGNFKGTAFNAVFVIKATLYYQNLQVPSKTIEYGQNISSVDFGTVSVVNSVTGIYSKQYTGKFRLAVLKDGGYVYDYVPDVTTDENTNVYVIFVPASAGDEYDANCHPFIEEYFLKVDKHDISDTIQIVEGDYDVVDGVIKTVFNNSVKSVKTFVPDPANSGNAQGLEVKLTYTNPESGEVVSPKDAGEYVVTVSVDDGVDNYSGSKTYSLIIDKAPLTINDSELTFTYQAKAIDYARPIDAQIGFDGFELNNFNYEVTFYTSLIADLPMSGSPAEIGAYYAKLKLVHANFVGEATVKIYIEPVFNGYTGLESEYGNIKAVTPVFEDIRTDGGVVLKHPSVAYSVMYKEKGTAEDEFVTSLPGNAGEYDVRVIYDQNGYDKVFDLEMTVARATAILDLEEEYSVTYNGRAINFNVELPNGIANANYMFKEVKEVAEGETSPEFTSEKPIYAGTYIVKIELIDNNYVGSGETKLVINKADLKVEETPVVDGKISFGSHKEDVKFMSDSGKVTFPATADTVRGTWTLETDISNSPVGTHSSYRVKFTPEDTDNFNSVTTGMPITIQKRDISNYIELKDEIENNTITYSYTSKGINVTPKINEDAGILKGFDDITFAIYYNNMSNAPVNVLEGGYTVRVVINSENYEGVYENEDLRLVITKATPIVSPPTVKDIKRSTAEESYPFDSSYLGSDGMAYIVYGESRITVNGTFTVADAYKGYKFTKANEQTVELMFTPSDTSSFYATIVTATVNVIGDSYTVTEDDIVVVSKDGNPVTYGAPLSDYIISLAEGSALNGKGTLEWVNPDKILHVGEEAEYKFIPNDTDKYNYTYGKTKKAEIGKAILEMKEGDGISYAELYVGNAIRDAVMYLSLYNQDHEEIAVTDYTVKIISSTEGYGLNEAPSGVQPGNYLDGEFVISITAPDYKTEEGREFSIKIYYVKYVEVFFAESTGKYYDGQAVTVENMKIGATDAIYKLGYDCFDIVSVTRNGVAVDKICETGTYTVTVKVAEKDSNGNAVDGAHRGTFTFEYVISKMDISDSMTISGNKPYYSETANGASVKCNGYNVSAGEIDYAYYSYDKSTYLGSQPPTNAGSYKVIATISDSNSYYKGYKEFDYTVNKLPVKLTIDSQYNFVYGEKYSIVPEIDGVSSSAVKFTYQAVGYAYATEIAPTDAGTYRVTATVSDMNLTGTATSTLIISKAGVRSIAPPTVSALTYGTALKSAKFSDGSVESLNGSEIIEGRYEFKEPDKTDTPVGSRTVAIVFIPTNKNYEELELSVYVTVNKAEIAVEIGKTEVYYNGEAQYPEKLSDVNVRYSFVRDGMVVSRAVEAGNYTVTMTVDEDNYAGTAVVQFTIKRAVAIASESTLPVPADITYGMTLSTGAISGGGIVYVSGKSAVNGKFTYVHGDTVLGDVNAYDGVEIVFTPYDTDNYEPYYISMTVNVAKAVATVKASECTFVYGATISKPTFTTSPEGLSVLNTEFDTEMVGSIKDAGTYEFTATIDHKNYTGSVLYQVVILKKTVGIAYYSDEALVDVYNAQYGSAKSAKAHILDTDFVGSDSLKSAEIEKYMSYRYYGDTYAESMINPTAVGNYKVYTVLDHKNYTVDKTASTINYNIVKAHVKSVTFDSNTLSNQIYGAVVAPKVYTDPVGVGYRLEFPGYSDMPTSAGSYNIKVIIEDDNYQGDTVTAMFRINPKEISAENITAYGKPADGLASIKVTGELKGVMRGDEVSITFIAETEGGATGAGTYPVVIKSWTLSGLHANNYTLREPIYKLSATITNRTVRDNTSGAYITSSAGFSDNVTLEVTEVYDVANQTSFWTSLIGQDATIQKITLKDCGLETVLSNKIKFYVKIPEAYRDSETLEIKGRGGLEDVTFEREGDYVSFYADCSGEVLFYVNDFPYWIIIVAGAILIFVIGLLLIIFVSPVKRRKRIPSGARRAMALGNSVKGLDVKYERKMKAKKEEQKRRWKY